MSNPSPRISIITPTYNRRAVLERAIRSVQAQTCGDYEHLIIDDGSNDGTEALVASIADPRLRYFRFPERQGANAARNWGVEEARAEWITLLDSDDEFLPHRLERTLAWCDRSQGVPLLLSSFATEKREKRIVASNPEVLLNGVEFERALMVYGICIAGSCITVRRDVLREVGSFDPRIRRLQDREVLLRLSQRCSAQLSADVDWLKHPSADSISGPREGYIEALGEMLRAQPQLIDAYRTIVSYHIARFLLSDLLRGRMAPMVAGFQTNRKTPELGFGLYALLRGYFGGASLRRAWSAAAKQREVATSPTVSSTTVRPSTAIATSTTSREQTLIAAR